MRTLDCQVESIDLRARLIHDPLLRLRYLRRMTRNGLRVPVAPARPKRRLRVAALSVALFLLPAGHHTEANVRGSRPPAALKEAGADQPPAVWLVEKTAQFEIYSNGLRIENPFAVANHPRSYVVFPRSSGQRPAPEARTDPAGIVFHTTESHLAAFEPGEAAVLKRVGQYLLQYVRDNKFYNFVVDRFGRVHRIVEEGDAANHAGWSVWADERWVYVNLNESFLAVAFEAQSRPEDRQPSVNPAQVHAARMLIEMLRSKYRIPASNCVTHAQVSVNPRNMGVGYHTDWADNFPYHSVGLPDNYDRPLASVLLFGFELDGSLEASGLERGMLAAEIEMRREAASRGMASTGYRAALRSRWRETLSALESIGSNKEKGL